MSSPFFLWTILLSITLFPNAIFKQILLSIEAGKVNARIAFATLSLMSLHVLEAVNENYNLSLSSAEIRVVLIVWAVNIVIGPGVYLNLSVAEPREKLSQPLLTIIFFAIAAITAERAMHLVQKAL